MNNKKIKGFAALISMLVTAITGCGKQDFDPSKNHNVEIYGPPEVFEQYNNGGVSDNNTEIETEIDEEYSPEENVPVCIYGPPEMFENENEGAEMK